MAFFKDLCWVGLVLGTAGVVADCRLRAEQGTREPPLPVTVEPLRIAQLGSEHFANAVYRRGTQGARIASWGDRILQWPIQADAPAAEVVSFGKDLPGKQVPGRYRAGLYSNGGCALDVDGNGTDEVIVVRSLPGGEQSELLWFEERAGQPQWQEHVAAQLARDPNGPPHDIVPLEMKVRDKTLRGVVVVIGRNGLVWYQIPDQPAQPWLRREVASLEGRQSGMSIGDLAGRGRPDVACGMWWAECPADPSAQPWRAHRYGWNDSPWAGMAKTALGDVNGDGRLDIVASEAEIPDARLAVFCCDPAARQDVWRSTLIEKGLYCPHSLVVVDANRDGRLDVIVGEMTAGGWQFPLNPAPRILLYLNQGDLKFQRHVLHTGRGVHEMRLAPLQADGKLFLYAADEIQLFKFPDMTTHVVGWTIHP